MRRLVLGVAGLAWLAAAGTAGCATAPAWGIALEGNPVSAAGIAAYRASTGLTPRYVVVFQQWPEDPATGEFPLASVEAISSTGAIPVLTWEPMYYRANDGAETMVPAGRVTGGAYDRYLERFARAASATGKPIFIRFAHEMNLNRYHWGGTAAEYGPQSPERFKAMWRHVVDVFRRLQVTNVQWVFCPNCESVPGAGDPAITWNRASAYYPGDGYVDVLGMDGYNWGDTQTPEKNGWRSSWRSFGDTFGALHAELKRLAPGKPIYVFETASAASGGDKRTWLADMARTAAAWSLSGVIWFEANKEVDWRLMTALPPRALEPLRGTFAR
jgi:beta-mannanase